MPRIASSATLVLHKVWVLINLAERLRTFMQSAPGVWLACAGEHQSGE